MTAEAHVLLWSVPSVPYPQAARPPDWDAKVTSSVWARSAQAHVGVILRAWTRVLACDERRVSDHGRTEAWHDQFRPYIGHVLTLTTTMALGFRVHKHAICIRLAHGPNLVVI